MELIIDETGRVRELAHGEGTAIAIRALGLAGVRIDADVVSVTWDVQRVEHDVLMVLRKFLAESKHELPFRLSFFYGGWLDEVYGDRWSALDRLDHLAQFAADEPANETFKIAKPIDPTAGPKVRELSNLWARTEGRLEASDLEPFARLSENLFAIENKRFGFIGKNTLAAQLWKPEDLAAMIGQPYDRDPADPPFARSVVDEYGTALARKQPHYDHVCAPLSLYGERRWLRYERLLCPFRLPGEREILAVLCEPSQSIDIPFPQVQAQ